MADILYNTRLQIYIRSNVEYSPGIRTKRHSNCVKDIVGNNGTLFSLKSQLTMFYCESRSLLHKPLREMNPPTTRLCLVSEEISVRKEEMSNLNVLDARTEGGFVLLVPAFYLSKNANNPQKQYRCPRTDNCSKS
jgi:hypothetical protein